MGFLAGILLQYASAPVLKSSTAVFGEQQELGLLKQKAESGDARARVELGLAYATGDGVAVDETEAVKWFRKAANQGHAAGEYFLSEMYSAGRGLPVDNVEALKWLRKSAEHGDPRGQANLGAVYSQGIGVAKDDAEAVKWMRKAAEQGFAQGQFGLGVMYAHGQGVPQDASEALKWYRRAGEQGDAQALNNMAFLLATSKDATVRNPNEAITIALKAVDASNESAVCLDTLATAYFEAGQYEKAVETEKKALAASPDNPSYKTALERYSAAATSKH